MYAMRVTSDGGYGNDLDYAAQARLLKEQRQRQAICERATMLVGNLGDIGRGGTGNDVIDGGTGNVGGGTRSGQLFGATDATSGGRGRRAEGRAA